MSGAVLESESKRLLDIGRAEGRAEGITEGETHGIAKTLVGLVESEDITKETAERKFGGTYEELVAAANKGK